MGTGAATTYVMISKNQRPSCVEAFCRLAREGSGCIWIATLYAEMEWKLPHSEQMQLDPLGGGKMRKYAMKILEILHGGMLLAAIYCIVMQQVTDDIRMLLRGLYLLIPCAVLSVCRGQGPEILAVFSGSDSGGGRRLSGRGYNSRKDLALLSCCGSRVLLF